MKIKIASSFLKIACFVAVILLFSSCSVVKYSQEINTLRSLAASDKKITKYLSSQEDNFKKLLKDYESKDLKEGLSKKTILSRYGDPVLEWNISALERGYSYKFLYRYPTRYFSSDKIYLYFDLNNKLAKIDYIPQEDL